MIFDAFKSIDYSGVPVVDVIRNYREYINRVLQNYQIVDHTIVGDPTPEYLAYNLYGDPNLFWVLIYINNITDPWHGWVKSQEAIYESAEQKYSKMGGVDQVLYHMDGNFEKYFDLVEYPENSEIWYHKGDKRYKHVQHVGYLHPVTVYEDENMINDVNRVIKIILPEDMSPFLRDLEREVERVLRSER